MTQPCWVCNH